ncbi:MAG: hypothetical protein ABFC88_12395 [Thermoguttaceae bacterium]
MNLSDQEQEVVETTVFYGVSVLINEEWVKRLVVGVPVADEPEGYNRIVTVLKRFREFANCSWQSSRVVRLDMEAEIPAQEWREVVRGHMMALDIHSLESAVHVLFGLRQ